MQKTSDKDLEAITRNMVTVFGTIVQVEKCIEEMAELTKELIKIRHAKTANELEKYKRNIAEELNDVYVTLHYIMLLYSSEAEQFVLTQERIERLTKKLRKKQKEYKTVAYERDSFFEQKSNIQYLEKLNQFVYLENLIMISEERLTFFINHESWIDIYVSKDGKEAVYVKRRSK